MEIRMVPEVQEWLAEMRGRDPAAAEGVDEAVAALRAGGTSVGPPLVIPVEGRPGSGAPAPTPNERRGAGERLADLRRRYAALLAEEERVTVASQRLQATINDFRTHMEAAKAAYRATQEAADATWAELDRDDGASPAVQDAGPGRPAPFWLSELRPGTPESAGARLLFTVEPPGTAVLLAAGTEEDRQNAWYAEAIARSRFRYQRTLRRRA